MFWLRNKKINFRYALVTKVLCLLGDTTYQVSRLLFIVAPIAGRGSAFGPLLILQSF